ncbi:hypothetical protein KGD82_16615 [Nocardiopsis eucommiae]|uniref:Uncharacterized protein n=1 Tax=Nocardiopsis eucommiae TaxID=2831970 RepID=A0A975L7K7_9ACTN|nr:hypothetical protein KGD82_16615 [Nocardiopsis eucommiae]
MPEIAERMRALVADQTGNADLAALVHKAIAQAYRIGANRGLEEAANVVGDLDPEEWGFGFKQSFVSGLIRDRKVPVDPPPPDGVRVQSTTYRVSAVPGTHPDASHFTVAVEYRGHDLWAVTRHAECLSRAGEWVYEILPSERTDEWVADHRFAYTEAMRRAREIAPTLTVMGRSVTEVLQDLRSQGSGSDACSP